MCCGRALSCCSGNHMAGLEEQLGALDVEDAPAPAPAAPLTHLQVRKRFVPPLSNEEKEKRKRENPGFFGVGNEAVAADHRAFCEEMGLADEHATDAEIKSFSVKKLKRYITYYGQSTAGLLEKADLVARVHEIRDGLRETGEASDGLRETGLDAFLRDRQRNLQHAAMQKKFGRRPKDPNNPMGDWGKVPAPIEGSSFETVLRPTFEELETKDDAWLREYIAAARKSSPRDLTGDRAVDGCPHYPAPALEDLNDHEALLKEATYSKMKLHEVWDMCYYIGVCTDPL